MVLQIDLLARLQFYTLLFDDQNSLYYNPAGLALNEKLHWEVINPAIDIAANTLKTTQKMTYYTLHKIPYYLI